MSLDKKLKIDGYNEKVILKADSRPKAIIQGLDLLRPIYRNTAAYGHFGRTEPEFTWEHTDKAELLRDAAGLGSQEAVSK